MDRQENDGNHSGHDFSLNATAQAFKAAFKTEESRFMLFTSMKIMMAPLFSIMIIFFTLFMFIRLDYIFFKANGLAEIKELEEAFYDYIFGNLSNFFPFLGVFFVILFFLGHFIASLLLRPFRSIGSYCLKSMENESDSSFQTFQSRKEIFYDFKILTSFSEVFFDWIDKIRLEKNWSRAELPAWSIGVHRPIFEKAFFYKFSLFLYIICISSSFFLYYLTVEIHNQIVSLAIKTLKNNASVNYFLQQQSSLFFMVVGMAVLTLIASYTYLSISLYNQVSGAAFAIFSTMRSFMKGNYSARVHLIGFQHIRVFCRYLNKYLDYIEDNSQHDSKPQSSLTKSKRH